MMHEWNQGEHDSLEKRQPWLTYQLKDRAQEETARLTP